MPAIVLLMRGAMITGLIFSVLMLWLVTTLVGKMHIVTGKVEAVRTIYSQPANLEELDEQSLQRQADSLANFLR